MTLKTVFGNYNKQTGVLHVSNHKVANTSIDCELCEHGFTSRGFQSVNVPCLNYVFAFVRNPFDRLVSRYEHLRRRRSQSPKVLTGSPQDNNLRDYFAFVGSNKPLEFSSFVDFTVVHPDEHWEVQYDKFCRQLGSIDCLDFIGRYENLQPDFEKACIACHIPVRQLRRCNSTCRKPYAEYYDSRTRQLVAEVYEKDLEVFGYEFGRVQL